MLAFAFTFAHAFHFLQFAWTGHALPGFLFFPSLNLFSAPLCLFMGFLIDKAWRLDIFQLKLQNQTFFLLNCEPKYYFLETSRSKVN